MKRCIEIGDIVSVKLLERGYNTLRGVVCYMPAATGDSWIIEEQWAGVNGQEIPSSDPPLHYVQQFSRITLISSKEARP